MPSSGTVAGMVYGSPTARTTREKGFGIIKSSQRRKYQARSAAHASGSIGMPPIRAMTMTPGLNSYFGPCGPSAVVTIEKPRFIIACMSRNARAPLWLAEPRMTSAPHARAMRSGTSPSTDADTRKHALKPRRSHCRMSVEHSTCCWCQYAGAQLVLPSRNGSMLSAPRTASTRYVIVSSLSKPRSTGRPRK